MEECPKKAAPTTTTTTLLDLSSKETALANLRHIGDVGEMDISLLEDILPHCTLDQLTRIENLSKGRDLSSVTDRLWKRFYERTFGVDSANKVMETMQDGGLAKVENTKEKTARLAQKLLKGDMKKLQRKKKVGKLNSVSQTPTTSCKRMNSSGGSDVSTFKSNLMKKARIECATSFEVSMRKASRQNNHIVLKSVPHPTHRCNSLRPNSYLVSKLGTSGTRR